MLASMHIVTGILLVALVWTGATVPSSPAVPATSARLAGWQWPVDPPHIIEPYRAPAHRYGPGHRGIDLGAPIGARVAAPAAGVVAFAGDVAGRPIVTIDHGVGLVSTLEPVAATVPVGAVVRAGDTVGSVSTGGHTPAGAVHFGVRENGEYISPIMLLRNVPRAVLLPCC